MDGNQIMQVVREVQDKIEQAKGLIDQGNGGQAKGILDEIKAKVGDFTGMLGGGVSEKAEGLAQGMQNPFGR